MRRIRSAEACPPRAPTAAEREEHRRRAEHLASLSRHDETIAREIHQRLDPRGALNA